MLNQLKCKNTNLKKVKKTLWGVGVPQIFRGEATKFWGNGGGHILSKNGGHDIFTKNSRKENIVIPAPLAIIPNRREMRGLVQVIRLMFVLYKWN